MAYYTIEVFGHITYSSELSYHDLLELEETAKATVQGILEKSGGEFIHFEAMGDTLRFQCLLPEENDEVFHAICDGFAPHANEHLDIRLLFVDKDLGSIYFYSISAGKWQEATVALPPPGYLPETTEPVIRKALTDHPKGTATPEPKSQHGPKK